MGHRIVKMPSGKFAIFSTIVDDIIVYDATPEQLIDYYVEKKREEIIEEITAITNALAKGERAWPHQRGNESWAETVAWIEQVHSEARWCATCGKPRTEECDCDARS